MKMYACIVATAVLSLSGSVLANGPPNPPSLEGRSLENVLDQYSNDLQEFYLDNGRRATVTSGVAYLKVSDRNSSEYLNAIDLAYKSALTGAYARMATRLSRSGTQAETNDEITQRGTSENVARQMALTQCLDEAETAFARHQRQSEASERAKEQEKDSLLGLVKERLKTEERRAQDEQILAEQAQEVPEDFVYECEIPGDIDMMVSGSEQSVTDILSGGRVWASFLHDNQVGVVLVKTDDSSELAYILENQIAPSQVLGTARQEVRERIMQELEMQPGIPEGIVGTRMMRLSNNEWAVYAFGAGQINQSSSGMQGLANDMARSAAEQRATAELSRFSGLMIDSTQAMQQIDLTEQKYIVEVNVTRGTHRVTKDETSMIGQMISRSQSTSSNINLLGAEPIMSRKIESDDVSFYLSSIAWSPSIMAINTGDRAAFDNAGPDAAMGKSADGEEAPKDSKVRILNRDW